MDLISENTILIRRTRPAEPVKSAEPEAEKPALSPDAAPASCPRCGAKLVSPESLGWCPQCQYCRTLEEDAPKVALASKVIGAKTSPLGAVEFVSLLKGMPHWLRVLFAGMIGVVLVSLVGNFLFSPLCLGRAVWSTIQLGTGLLGLIAAQVWALLYIAPEDDRLGAKDVILAGRLWTLTFKYLPQTARQVWIGAWSATAMACAVLLVGGLSYWTRFYRPERIADKNLIQAAMAMAQGKASSKDLTESLEDFANKQDLTKKKDDKDDQKPDKRATLHCVILGYNVGPGKELLELVLGTLQDDVIRYAGRVKRGLTPEANQELLPKLEALRTGKPLIPGLQITAVWVKPQLFCEVHQSGYDDQGHLKDPKYSALLQAE